VASAEPDDDLSAYIVPPDPEPVIDATPGINVPPVTTSNVSESVVISNTNVENLANDTVGSDNLPAGPVPNTAQTELVLRLEAELAAARAALSGSGAEVASWAVGPPPIDPAPGDTVIIHVREDGFTSNGQVWYVGQEIEFEVGTPAWRDTCDRTGKSWVLLTDGEQLRRWGQVKFGHGPWPGLPWKDGAAADRERNRNRVARPIQQLATLKTKLT